MTTILLAQLGEQELEQGLMNQAIAFFNAGSRCSAGISLTPSVTNSPMAPAVVCYAFSTELYLKLLHALTVGNPGKIHGLKYIFMALPQETRLKANNHYHSTDSDIETDIATVNSAFVDWRYIHEQATISINPQVLINIARAIHLTVRELKPELHVFGENNTVSGK